MKFCLGVNAVLFKQCDVLGSLKARDSVRCSLEVEKSSLFSLFAPFVSIAVAVEDYI